jgi:hypothetical protein
MQISTITGHLTQTNKKHINAILSANLLQAKVNTINYFLTLENDIYSVKIIRKDNTVVLGAKINISRSTFKIN